MKSAICPGTFDPPTLGHLDIIKKAAKIFDKVYVAIGSNSRKKEFAFSLVERTEFLKKITQGIPNVEIVTFPGLLVDLAKELEASVIIRSIRNITDIDYESIQGQMNRLLWDIETLYLIGDEKFRFISSTLVREIASHGKRLHAFIPSEIEASVFEHLYRKRTKI